MMLRQRINYWNCSKFADWVRGIKKPYALTHEEWEDWREKASKKNPWRFYFTEKLLNKIQNFFFFPFDLLRTIRVYLSNRFVHKTHFLKTRFKPGHFYELDDRILFGLFNELKDFVEIELSGKLSLEETKKHKFVGLEKRSISAGLAYLDWATSLKYDDDYCKKEDLGKPTPQAKSAKQILELYNWWKSRDSRPCPMEISGWSEAYKEKDSKKRQQSHKKLMKIEEDYDKEDEKMLIKLIKIRKELWS